MSTAEASRVIRNPTGLHARPAVKLTQLAKRFTSKVEVATDPTGPWTDAKSPVRILRVKAACGTTLHVRADGADASDAVEAVAALIERDFDESEAGHG